ncbi:retrovirus-related pol polyprotein from transposon TNT 1-94 [Tanacetum coccineum]
MNELVNDGIKLSKLEINTCFINGLPKKWLSICQSLRNTNQVKDFELASLFGKLKYEENLIDSVYETEKKKYLTIATPLSTAFISTSIVQDFQDSPDDEEDTRSSQEYMKDLEEEFKRALLAKSKRFFRKGTQRFSSAKETDQTECHKYGRKCHFARYCFSKTLVPSYSSPFQNNSQPKFSSSSQQKPKVRPIKDFEAKYNKVKAKLALLSSGASASKSLQVLMALADDESGVVGKESARINLPNHDTSRILPSESQVKVTNSSVNVTDSSVTNYDSADESLVCSNPLPPLEKLVGVEPVSGPKTIKSILKSNSTFKDEALKGVTINEPTSTHAKGNKNVSSSKKNPALAGKLENVKTEDDIPLSVVMKELNDLKLQINKNQSSYSSFNKPQQCDIRNPIWYLDSGCSRHMTGVKSYLHKYMWNNQALRWYLEMTLHTPLKDTVLLNVMFDEKKGIIFNSNKEVMMITPRYSRYNWVYFLKKKSHAHESIMSFIKRVENQNDINVKQLRTANGIEFRNSILVKFCDEKRISQNFSSPYIPEQNGVAERENRTLIEAARTMLSGSIFSKQYWTEVVATTLFIHNHKDHLEKFNEKADDGYFLGYSLVSKAFRVFNTRRQQPEETFHIIFDESTEAIKFLKLSVDDITIVESERYPHDEYLHLFEPFQRYQVNSNVVQFIEPYERLEPIVTEVNASIDQNDQADQFDLNDQNDHPVQTDEILNDYQPEHLNHNNDEHIIDNLTNTKDAQIT